MSLIHILDVPKGVSMITLRASAVGAVKYSATVVRYKSKLSSDRDTHMHGFQFETSSE